MTFEHEGSEPPVGLAAWPAMQALSTMQAIQAFWPAWSGWMDWMVQWQRAWSGTWAAWPGLNGVRPTLPLLWDPGFLMPRVDARITPVASEEGSEAARVSMMMRVPRYGCLGPADLVAVEAFIARRPDPAALSELAHPAQAVAPLPALGAGPARRALPVATDIPEKTVPKTAPRKSSRKSSGTAKG